MKKIIGLIVVLVLLAAGGWYWTNLKGIYNKAEILSKNISGSSLLNDIKQAISAPPPLRGSEDNPNAKLTRYGVISLTNAQRQQQGLPTLSENSKLDQAAELKLKDMFAKQYFEHISPSGVGPGQLAENVHYSYVSVGENLALGNFTDDHALVTAWMNSPGHRANILNTKYKEIGVAVGQGQFDGHLTWLAVQEFGQPASSCPSIDAALKAQIDSLNIAVQNEQQELNAEKTALDSMPLKTKSDYDAYNQKAAIYNSLVNTYNNNVATLKNLVNQYNAEVNAYNACAG